MAILREAVIFSAPTYSTYFTMRLQTVLIAVALTSPSYAFFDQFFQQQQRQRSPEPSHQDRFNTKDCAGYLCPDTLTCVDSQTNCPCPFPDSQIKCMIPPTKGNKHNRDGTYVCISKGSRDCKFVMDAYKGLV